MDAILITGPTASGKSALAVELAENHNGEIINADSMQVYDTLHVLTARPGEAEMGSILHHLYGTVPAASLFSTGAWLRAVEPVIEAVRRRGRIPVLVGGTGLYFRALTGGLSDMPLVPDQIRMRWRALLADEGSAALHRALAEADPEMAGRLSSSDSQRVLRALEVMEASGKSILNFQRNAGKALVDPENARKIIVLPDRALLHDRINRRFELMLENGAIAEVEALLAKGLSPELPAMKAIGVPQIVALMEGRLSRQSVIEQSAAATRQYAKRQMTWFRNQMDESWARLG